MGKKGEGEEEAEVGGEKGVIWDLKSPGWCPVLTVITAGVMERSCMCFGASLTLL